jgi:hypothetical protein
LEVLLDALSRPWSDLDRHGYFQKLHNPHPTQKGNDPTQNKEELKTYAM